LPGLTIPKTDRDGIAILREMPNDTLSLFLSKVEKSPYVVPVVSGLSPQDAEQAFDSLNTMYTIQAFNEVSTDEFIDDVCEALQAHGELGSAQESPFRERLARLLDIEALGVAAKGASLQSEHEHLFCSARVITDARPVYGKNVTDTPVAMIITHMLKFSYHEATGRLQEFYIGLGSGDIRELKDALTRAEEKTKSLRAAIDPKVKFIDPQE
jgi:hypothetical protein